MADSDHAIDCLVSLGSAGDSGVVLDPAAVGNTAELVETDRVGTDQADTGLACALDEMGADQIGIGRVGTLEADIREAVAADNLDDRVDAGLVGIDRVYTPVEVGVDIDHGPAVADQGDMAPADIGRTDVDQADNHAEAGAGIDRVEDSEAEAGTGIDRAEDSEVEAGTGFHSQTVWWVAYSGMYSDVY